MTNKGTLPRGPARWERAALAALHHPHTQAAKLYRERVALAVCIVKTLESVDVPTRKPFQHIRTVWIGRERVMKRKYATCSTYCTVMQICLDWAAKDIAGVKKAFTGNPWGEVRGLDVKTLPRDVRCQVCGTTIKRGR